MSEKTLCERIKENACCLIAFIAASIFYVLSFFNVFLPCGECINQTINGVAVLILSALFIYFSFSILSQKETLKTCDYVFLHLAHIFIPLALFFQKNTFGTLAVVLSAVLTWIISFFIRKKLKDVNKKHLENLKFANLFLFTIFTILLALLKLCKSEAETKLYFVFIAPLLVLRVIYEGLLLDKGTENCNKETEAISPST